MSAIMLNLIGSSSGEPAPTVIGQAYGGGYYAGQIGIAGVATHYLVVGPLATAETTLVWKDTNTFTTGCDSVIDGPQNTADMIADGDATVYPCAHFCNDLSTGGKTDWYMPAKNELEVCYFNLKPGTASNTTGSGINANAVPVRVSNYTAGNPAQTSAAAFRTGSAEPFAANIYWTSTDENTAPFRANTQQFNAGYQSVYGKSTTTLRVRAIRRVLV